MKHRVLYKCTYELLGGRRRRSTSDTEHGVSGGWTSVVGRLWNFLRTSSWLTGAVR